MNSCCILIRAPPVYARSLRISNINRGIIVNSRGISLDATEVERHRKSRMWYGLGEDTWEFFLTAAMALLCCCGAKTAPQILAGGAVLRTLCQGSFPPKASDSVGQDFTVGLS